MKGFFAFLFPVLLLVPLCLCIPGKEHMQKDQSLKMKQMVFRSIILLAIIIVSLSLFLKNQVASPALSAEQIDYLNKLGFATKQIEDVERRNGLTRFVVDDITFVELKGEEVIRVRNYGKQDDNAQAPFSLNDAYIISEELLRLLLNFSEDYVVVSRDDKDDDYYKISIMREYENGVRNPYDGVNATFRKTNNSIANLVRFDFEATCFVPMITERQALTIAMDYFDDPLLNVSQVILTFEPSDRAWNVRTDAGMDVDVTLVYDIRLNENTERVLVDACSGQVIYYEGAAIERNGE